MDVSGALSHDALREYWLGGPEDRLCAREQAKAWALREMWLAQDKSTYGLYSFIASKVRKTKNGKPTGDHPHSNSIQELFAKVDGDDEWFPGKSIGGKRGPKRILTGGKKSAIVSAAKRLKASGDEPTYGAVVAACPKATLNAETGEPVSKELVYKVFRESCYDDEGRAPGEAE